MWIVDHAEKERRGCPVSEMTKHIASDLPGEVVLRFQQHDHLGRHFCVTALQQGSFRIRPQSFPRQGFEDLDQETQWCFLCTVKQPVRRPELHLAVLARIQAKPLLNVWHVKSLPQKSLSASAPPASRLPARPAGSAPCNRTARQCRSPSPETPAASTRSGGRGDETARPAASPTSRCTRGSASSAPPSAAWRTRI